MDGLLIDSEPFWCTAEMETFKKVGVPLTKEMTLQTTGLRVDEVVEYWYRRYPWKKFSKVEVAKQIDEKVIALVKQSGKALPGVNEAIKLCTAKKLPIAVASSSSLTMIDGVLNKLGLSKDIIVICSAHNELYGKPHPAVFLTTLRELNRKLETTIHADQCLVFEDSINGITAAKAAKMKCIAVPDSQLQNDKRLAIADIVLNSLNDLTPQMLK